MLCLSPGPVTDRNLTPLGLSSRAVILVVLALCCLGVGLAVAHEGHDEMQAAAASGAPDLPRLVISSETYELVAVREGERLTIYLDRFEDNVPVAAANITVTVNDEPVIAQPSGEGTYSISSKRFGSRGLVELVFDIKAKDGDDLLIGKFTLAGSAQDARSPEGGPMVWPRLVVCAPRCRRPPDPSDPRTACGTCTRPRFASAPASRIAHPLFGAIGAGCRSDGSCSFGPRGRA